MPFDLPPPNDQRTLGLLFSGGLDSAILLGQMLAKGWRVRPFYIRSGLLWQRAEERAAGRFLEALACPGLEPLVTLSLPLADVYQNHWSVTGLGVPDAATPDEAVYLPGRNPLLVIKAALWCRLNGIDELALAPLNSNPFADATPEFFAEFQSALNRATLGDVRLVRPFSELSKCEVMELGRGYPLELTFSCIKPAGALHCGTCNKCHERREAFRLLGAGDPTAYAGRPDAALALDRRRPARQAAPPAEATICRFPSPR
jgi:7-cyano-7-deazaguanine synthase